MHMNIANLLDVTRDELFNIHNHVLQSVRGDIGISY